MSEKRSNSLLTFNSKMAKAQNYGNLIKKEFIEILERMEKWI
jgi:hypothetical protein